MPASPKNLIPEKGSAVSTVYLRIIIFPLFFLLWEVIANSGLYNPNLFPPPSTVAKTFWTDLQSGLILSDTLASISRVLVGYASGVTLGILLGLSTGLNRFADASFGQMFLFIRPIPPISFVPLAVLWFGLGEFTKYFLVFIGVFFPVWMNTHLGVKHVNKDYIWAARSMGSKSLMLIYDVYLPAAAPFIFAGLRVSVAISFYCLVAAEIAGAFSGIAYRIEESHLSFRTDRMLAGLIILGVLSATADFFLSTAIKRFVPWSHNSKDNTDN